jgi:hypothetical protein
MADLIANTALSAVPVKCRHLYASWSAEQLYAQTNERHVAVWPNGEALELREGITTEPADLLSTSFSILVWEEAASEATGLYDDDTANQAWLALYEAIRARLYVRVSVAGAAALGGAGLVHQFIASNMGMRGATRFMEFNFRTQSVQSFT